MDKKTFGKICAIVYEKSGITLAQGKEALVTARLQKRMRTLGLEDYREYIAQVEDDAEEVVQLLDAISTNVTYFFREPEHFRFLDRIFREWIAGGQTRFRIWSAASSTGEEPYSVGITFHEAAGGARSDFRLLATDISTRVLERAKAGVYTAASLKTVSPMIRSTYFQQVRQEGEGAYAVRPLLRKGIAFHRLNLSAPPFVMKGPLDVILCRNVMIYFDDRVRKRLLSEMYRLLRPGGYLLVGHAESLAAVGGQFKVICPSIYRKG